MTTHGNLSGSVGKPPDGFEASGLSPDQAERLSAEFKPSWELDDAPNAHPIHAVAHENGSYGSPQLDARHAAGDAARTVAPHAPPPRVETHEPEVSVIIDRSITAAEMDLQRAPAPRPAAVAQPAVVAAFPAPVASAPRVAPVLRPPRSPDESIELPASLKKSNKGLFLGLGVAAIAAVLVLVVHGATTSSSDAPTAAAPTTAPTTTAEAARAAAASPIPPPPAQAATIPPPPPAAVAQAAPAAASPTRPSAPVHAQAAVRPAPPPPPAPVHHAAPRNPPTKPAAGGIVRDNPF